jgi:DNA-binding transcriptional regulator LsrR (DeoR family)
MSRQVDHSKKVELAIRVSRMYYYEGIKTAAIARELHISRSTVSRLLTFAKTNGLVNIQIYDPARQTRGLEKQIETDFGLKKVQVVMVDDAVGEHEWLAQVAQYAAGYLNSLFDSNMNLGIAWGTTINAISHHLVRKSTYNSHITLINGTGNPQTTAIAYAVDLVMRYARNYRARAHILPVPTYFDSSKTKQVLWEERSMKRLLTLRHEADFFLISIGSAGLNIPSHLHSGGYLEAGDYRSLEQENVAGDIAGLFFRQDGSYEGIPINQRASGPSLDLIKEKPGLCVVSGPGKNRGLYAALQGGLISELILDEPTAVALLELSEHR